MTRKPSRLRRWLKWAGLFACLAIVGLWGISGSFLVVYATGKWGVTLWPGGCEFSWNMVRVDVSEPMFLAGRLDEYTPLARTRPFLFWWPSRRFVGNTLSVAVPYWTLLSALAPLTAFLWYRDRRPPPGHCQACGYDLTGNVSGKCPECGDPYAGMLE